MQYLSGYGFSSSLKERVEAGGCLEIVKVKFDGNEDEHVSGTIDRGETPQFHAGDVCCSILQMAWMKGQWQTAM
jgi:hypothetical protein